MLWKAYFWFIVVFSLSVYLWLGFPRIWEIMDVPFTIVGVIGLVGFCWEKRILNQLFWKTYFFADVIWCVVYSFAPPHPKDAALDMRGISESVSTIFGWAIIIPAFVALFLYSFGRSDIWED